MQWEGPVLHTLKQISLAVGEGDRLWWGGKKDQLRVDIGYLGIPARDNGGLV